MEKKIDLAEGLTHFKAKENASIAITEATSTASAPHKAGEYFYYKGDIVIATADIAQGGTITLNTNCKKQPLADSVCELKTALYQVIQHEATSTVTHDYAVGDYFIYDYTNSLFRVKTQLTAGDTIVGGSNVQAVSYSSLVNLLVGLLNSGDASVEADVNAVLDKLLSMPYVELYDSAKITAKYYIQSTGVPKSQNGWNITDYLPIAGQITYSGITSVSNNVYSAFYDSTKTLLANDATFRAAKGINSLTPPAGAKYVRFSLANADLNSFSYVCKITPSLEDIDTFPDVLAVPDDIYLYEGIQTNIYRDSLFAIDDTPNNMLSAHGLNYNECWRLEPTQSLTGTETLTVQRCNNTFDTVLKSKDVTIHYGSSSNNSGTVNCLFLGDSTTEQGNYLYPLLNNYTEDSTEIVSIGTRETLNYSSIMCEGRSGWRLFDYVTYDSLSTVTNAFWNPTSEEFDFSYYMTQNQSGVTLDYVFILLGLNDVVKLGIKDVASVKAAASDFVTNLETVVSSIKDYDSNIKVVFGLITAPSKSQDAWYNTTPNDLHYRDQFKRNIVIFNDEIIKAESSNSDIYLLDTNLCIDAKHNMSTTTVQVNSRNTETVVRQNNLVHYPVEGGAQVADRIFSFIKNI